MATISFELSDLDRNHLTDSLIRVIAQVPQIVGTEINWTERSALSIIDLFQSKGVDGLSGMGVMQISKFIEELTTPVSRGYAHTAAELVFAELAKFTERMEQKASEPTAPAAEAEAVIPSDETHEFALAWKEMAQVSGRPVSHIGPLTEIEALKMMAEYREANGVQRLLLLARPKQQPWTVLDYGD